MEWVNEVRPARPEVTIWYPDGARLDVLPDGSSSVREALMEPAYAELRFVGVRYVEIPLGAWVELDGLRYTLHAPAAVVRQGQALYEFTARFESEARALDDIIVMNIVDGRTNFTLTATPREHAQQVVDNMNARGDGGWTLGPCVEGAAREISYSGTRCLAALGMIADTFSTEWRCEGRRLTVRRVGHGEENPVQLSYGAGLKPGVQRAVHGEDGNPIGRLFVQGGERNIDPAAYGADRLRLPKGTTIRFDGNHFEGEPGYTAARAQTYITDTEGRSVAPAVQLAGVMYREESLALEDVYPHREGVISKVKAYGLDFYDSELAREGIDYSELRVPGEKATVVFQSGMLAGRELDIEQTADSITGYTAREGHFAIVPQEEGGVTIPSKTYPVAVGDRYAVFHVRMPDAYLRAAEAQMLRAAVRYLHPRAGHRFAVRAEVDGVWARARWDQLGGRLGLGGYVRVADADLFGAAGGGSAVLRIVAVTRTLEDPRAPMLELSNEPAAGSVATQLARARAQEQIVAERYADARRYTRRTYTQAQQGLQQLADAARAMQEKFAEGIKPASVHTMGALVGSEATNFSFEHPEEFTWVPEGKRLEARCLITASGSNRLVHYSLPAAGTARPNEIRSGAKEPTRAWRLDKYASGSLTRANAPYYLYAVCAAQGSEGQFAVFDAPQAFTRGDAYYLLVALISGEDTRGGRSVQPVYGVTEVTPGMVRTDRIVSGDGRTYFDLAHGEIGGNLRFTVRDDESDPSRAQENDNLIPNGGPFICKGPQWVTLWDYDKDEERKWTVRKEYIAERACGSFGRMRYTARGRRKTNSEYRFVNIGLINKRSLLENSSVVYVTLGIKECSHPRAVKVSCYYNGIEKNFIANMLPAGTNADGPIYCAADSLPVVAHFGAVERKEGDETSMREANVAWYVDTNELPWQNDQEEITVVLELVWVRMENGSKFTYDVNRLRGGRGQGFTLLDGGMLRTFGLELMRGVGGSAQGTAGLWGGGNDLNYNTALPAIWAGGSFAQAMAGEASTVFRHDGSAKIGPMVMDTDGNIVWVDNDSLFKITPMQDIPSLATLRNEVGSNETRSASNLLPSAQSDSIQVDNTVQYHGTNYSPHAERSFNGSYIIGAIRRLPSAYKDAKVKAKVTVTLQGDVIATARGPKDGADANVAITFNGTLRCGGERKTFELFKTRSCLAGNEPKYKYRHLYESGANDFAALPMGEDFRLDWQIRFEMHAFVPPNLPDDPDDPDGPGGGGSYYGYSVDAFRKRGALYLPGAEGSSRPVGHSGGIGHNTSFAKAAYKDVRVTLEATIEYEEVVGQQRFIIGRNGFVVFHSATKYIYCNCTDNTFEIKGTSLH